MNEAFQNKLHDKLNAFREWSRTRHFQGCRLVQYCGVECMGGIDVALHEVEMQIEGVFSEGFGVDWNEHQGRLYLAVWEPAELEWTWPQVFVEEHLADLSWLADLSQGEPPTQ